jgi:hypothetical protein
VNGSGVGVTSGRDFVERQHEVSHGLGWQILRSGGLGSTLPFSDKRFTSTTRSCWRALPCCLALMNHSRLWYPNFSRALRCSLCLECAGRFRIQSQGPAKTGAFGGGVLGSSGF